MKNSEVTVIIMISILFFLCIFFFSVGWIIFSSTFTRSKKKKHKSGLQPKMVSPASFHMDKEWIQSIDMDSLEIQSHDGLTLRARIILSHKSEVIVICCHGYHAHGASLAKYAHMFHSLGFSVLLPDARAHGKSDGKYIGMGVRDSSDLKQWIHYISQMYPQAEIILFGVSMGGAAVMNTIGYALPPSVVCAIEDCGYVSLREVVTVQLRKWHLPMLLLYSIEPFTRLLCGFSILDRTITTKRLNHSTLPLLLIHGTSDTLISPTQLNAAALAHNGFKQTLFVQKAEHADSITADFVLYRNTIKEFADLYL